MSWILWMGVGILWEWHSVLSFATVMSYNGSGTIWHWMSLQHGTSYPNQPAEWSQSNVLYLKAFPKVTWKKKKRKILMKSIYVWKLICNPVIFFITNLKGIEPWWPTELELNLHSVLLSQCPFFSVKSPTLPINKDSYKKLFTNGSVWSIVLYA